MFILCYYVSFILKQGYFELTKWQKKCCKLSEGLRKMDIMFLEENKNRKR